MTLTPDTTPCLPVTPSPAPLFLLMSGMADARLATTPPPDGFAAVSRAGFTCWSSDPDLDALDEMFLGWACVGNPARLIHGPIKGRRNVTRALGDQAPDNGRFILVRKQGRSLIVSGDAFGQMLVFHGRIGDCAFCGNSLHLIAEAARRLRLPLSLCRGAVLSQMFADFDFAMHSNSRETVLSGISYAAPGEEITLTSSGLLTSRTAETAEGPIDPRDYDNLLDEAAASLSGTVLALSQGAERVVVPLTAGYDSRLVVGAALAAGLGDRLMIGTMSTGALDLRASAMLRDMFGLSEHIPDPGLAAPDFAPRARTGFAEHRSLSFGTYHEINLARGFSAFSRPGLFLHDVGGECHGNTYYSRASMQPWAAMPFSAAVVGDFLRSFGGPQRWPSEDAECLESFLHDEFQRLRGASFGEKMEDHYFVHGNRLQLGCNGEPTGQGSVIANPLMNPALLRISRRLSMEERGGHRLHIDLMRRFEPRLLDLPFNDGFKSLGDAKAQAAPANPDVQAVFDLAAAEKNENLQALVAMAGQALADMKEDSRFGTVLRLTAAPRFAWMSSHRPDHKFLPVWASRIIGLQDLLAYV